ncbi:hypothetical protein PPL_10179 [Heterostelium album PN500]|uniref:Uncharacterized protein n=1 Tax=Heterostelium pallidum (strain ATCC 26659 / Pp 5 / PN500) TaxID=670386 RepID=D3BQJ4_HETP5|nr:hypothetical protein PPL_10179 [Heterostelium album PN500]EFA76414.1 hypothetical protein PPL_10179 [Heterostelium album PN500]|eukprot:XP_020428546.1 hypothetical protein PPL_10179 [Heterostelium album PN500]
MNQPVLLPANQFRQVPKIIPVYVVELTKSNTQEVVYNSNKTVLVQIYYSIVE